MRESARIQTFPDDVSILGGSSNVQKQLGNAVPSAIGELLGKEIRKQFFGERVSSSNLKLIPKKQEGSPEIAFIKKLPTAYRSAVLEIS